MMPWGLLEPIGSFFHWRFRKITFVIIMRRRWDKCFEPAWHAKFYTCIPCSLFRLGLLATAGMYLCLPHYPLWYYIGMPFLIGVISMLFYRQINE